MQVAEHRTEVLEARQRLGAVDELAVRHVTELRTRVPEHSGRLAVERHVEERDVRHRRMLVGLGLEAGRHLVAGRELTVGDVEEQGRLGEQVHAQQRVDLHADLGGQLVEGEAHVAPFVDAVVLVLPGEAAGGGRAEGSARIDQGPTFRQVEEQVTVEQVQFVGADHVRNGGFTRHWVILLTVVSGNSLVSSVRRLKVGSGPRHDIAGLGQHVVLSLPRLPVGIKKPRIG